MVANADRLIRAPGPHGSTIEDLGGLDLILSAPSEHPEDVVIVALVDAWSTGRAHEVASWIANALHRCDDPIAFERSVEVVLAHSGAREALGDALPEALLARARNHHSADLGYIAATALHGLVVLLLGESAPVRQLDVATLLRDSDPTDDAAFALEAARMAGLVYAHWSDPSVRSAIVHGLDQLQGHPDVEVDALIEHAHVLLVDALEAEDQDAMQRGLADAEERFRLAADIEGDRIDARIYTCALRATRAFVSGGPSAVIDDSVSEIRELLSEREQYGHEDGLPLLSRRAVESAWGSLLGSLGGLGDDLDLPVWAQGADVVVRVLAVVETSRSVRLAPMADADMTPAVVPRLEATFVRNLYHRQVLAQCLASQALTPDQRDIAEELLAHVGAASSAHSGDPLVAGLGVDGAEALRDALPPDKLAIATERLRLSLPQRISNRDVQWGEAFESIVAALGDAPEFHGEVRGRVLEIVAALLDFVSLCLRVELGFGAGGFSYLGDPDAHESAMADHLAQYLDGALGGLVRTEVRHEGSGGRVDLLVSWGSDRLVVECKRDDNPVARGALDPYLAQTGRYLGTSIRIGALAVLDLSDKSVGGVRGLDASAWAIDLPSVNDAPERKIVCVVIPGNRSATPSAVGKATPKGR